MGYKQKSRWRTIEHFYKNSNVLSLINEWQSLGGCLEEFTKEQKNFFIIYSRTWLSSYLATAGYLAKNYKVYVVCIMQKEPPRSVLRKRSSGNMHQIYRRTPVPKCKFNKVALLSCTFAVYFQNTFPRNTYGQLLLITSKQGFGQNQWSRSYSSVKEINLLDVKL